MSTLHVKIDRSARTAEFSGATFDYKEQIKQLGPARWLSAEKIWKVSDFDLSAEQLSEQFPNVVVQEEGSTEVSESSVPVSAEPVTREPSQATGLPESVTVRQLSFRIRQLLQKSFPNTIHVRGVLSSVNETRQGYVFMDLAEEEKRDETLSCVIWRDANKICKKLNEAGFRLEADLQVMFEVRVGFSPKRGSISLEVVSIVAEYTLAKLAAQREITNDRLRKEGLFEKNKQLPLAFLPRRLGILTSSGGTVINDFRASLDTAQFGFELFWCNVGVQGSEAKPEILAGLERLCAMPLDAILVFRGGGSAADLAVFNDYDIAKAVCLCPVPVVSAIGHQEDQSSVQDVSYRALGVPKDIGRFFADIVIERRTVLQEMVQVILNRAGELSRFSNERLLHFSRQIHLQAAGTLRARSEFLHRVTAAIPRLGARHVRDSLDRLRTRAQPIVAQSMMRCENQSQRCSEIWRLLNQLALGSLQRSNERMQYLEKLISGASPDVQLKRGFAIVKRLGSEQVVTAGEGLQENDEIAVQFHDMVRNARVLED